MTRRRIYVNRGMLVTEALGWEHEYQSSEWPHDTVMYFPATKRTRVWNAHERRWVSR